MEIKIDTKKELKEQLMRVYAEYAEDSEPDYAEESIPERSERDFFRGYKWAIDDMLQMIDGWLKYSEGTTISVINPERLKRELYTKTAKTLMRILDSDGKMG